MADETAVKGQEKAPVNKGSKPFGRSILLLAGAIIIIVLALALGLGLGLGLKHHHNGGETSTNATTPTASPAPPNTPSTVSFGLPSWRRDPAEYELDMSWDINAAPQTRVFNLTVTEIDAAPDGIVRTMLVINGQFPGPLIRVNEGDRLLVNVTNGLTNGTSMHWHGIYQNGTNWMDGSVGITQCPIPPGQSFLYNFTIEGQYGTYWYHSHFDSQYTDGIVGPLIVHAPAEAEVRKDYDYDQVVLLQDYYHDLSSALMPGYLASGNENTEPVPDNGLFQGTQYFNCSSYDDDSGYTCQDNSTRALFNVTPNKRYRIRLINTSAFTEFQFSIDNHTLSVIEADTTLVEPVTVHRIPIHVAQRYSFILYTNQTNSTNYWMRAQMNTFCFTGDNDVLDPDVLALITYTNTTTEPTNSTDWADALDLVCEDLKPDLLVPLYPQKAPEKDTTYVVDTSFQIGAYALAKGYFNSTTWSPATVPTLNQAVTGLHAGIAAFNAAGLSTAFSNDQFVIDIPGPQVIDLVINNFDEGSHPFHLHGHTFYILATSSSGDFNNSVYDTLNTTNPMRRDTMTVIAYGWSLIRFVADNPGLWALHCHISWHMQAGLLMQFQARNDIMKTWTLPADVQALCAN